jgi:magnesium transporter
MNDVMKALTIITTLFMPLSFLSGFFGMNFFQPSILLDAWTGRVAFGLTLGAMLLLPVGMYLWMRRRAWM